MRLSKKLLGLGMAGLLAVSFTACGAEAKDQSVTLVYEQEGVTMEYTLNAKGDIVHTLTQVSNMDCSMYTEEQIAMVESAMVEYSAVYEEYESVEHSYEINEDSLVETIKVDVSNSEELGALAEAGLLPIEGGATAISLEKTVESLESQGWTVKE